MLALEERTVFFSMICVDTPSYMTEMLLHLLILIFKNYMFLKSEFVITALAKVSTLSSLYFLTHGDEREICQLVNRFELS